MAKRTDANQTAVVRALRKAGCSVLILSDMGKGCPDLLVGLRMRNLLLEVKDGAKVPSARKLTPMEAAFHASWKGRVVVVNSAEEAIAAVCAL